MRLIILTLLSLQLSIFTIQAQIQKGELFKGSFIKSKILSNEVHYYHLNLEKDQFVFLELLQKDIDIVITTFDSKGDKIETFDSPNGKNGFERFTLTSNKKGKYAIEISSYDMEKPFGNYELKVETLKPKAKSPNEQVDEIFSLWNNNETPGVAIAIIKDDSIIYKKGYGMANLEYDIPINSSSIFNIGSVSKQFTIFAILLLEKQGKLSLNDDVRKYIPEVPDFGKKITLQHLASHTSGIREESSLFLMSDWRLDDIMTKEHSLKILSRQKELNFEPGDEYLYSNTGFTLLAEIVARVTNMSFAEFTKKNIFEPLKMKQSFFYDDHQKLIKNRTYSYWLTEEGIKHKISNNSSVGAINLFTSVEDLSLWSMNFSDPKVGDTSIINKMNTPVLLNDGSTSLSSLGQFVDEYKGLTEISHAGLIAGYRSYFARFPDENFSVIVLSNSFEFNEAKMTHEIVDIFLKDKIKPEKKVININEDTFSNYQGLFELKSGILIYFYLAEGQLYGYESGGLYHTFTPISITEFISKDSRFKIEFIPNKRGKIDQIKFHEKDQVLEAKRVKKTKRSSIKLSDFSGEFYSDELSTSYTFIVEEDHLIAKHSKLDDFRLYPLKKDLFTRNNWIFKYVRFIRDSNNNIIGFNATSDGVKKLFFKKIQSDNKR